MDTLPDKNRLSLNRLKKKAAPASFFITFVIMCFVWILFSGRFDLFHLSLGGISSLAISAASCRMLFPNPMSYRIFNCWVRFATYLPWLFNQIFLANLHVLYLTFHPRMMELINPRVIKFKSRLKTDVARTTLANSITLTPGTITIYAGVMGSFAVHCIDDKSSEGLPGIMEKKIAQVFDE